MELNEIIANRRSVKSYDPNHAITDDELKALFERVILSPSSFNLQHWRFVVVRDSARKKQLREISYNQEQVENASAVIVVAGKLDAHRDVAEIYKDAPEPVRQAMIPMIDGFYAEKRQMQRDEAIRSCSLAAMTLMLAAYDMGYATGPMIGFDPVAVGEFVGLDEKHVPVMMIVIGKKTGDMRSRAFRYPPSNVVKLESLDGEGLA
ncbi:MAG: nitroreductase family protein [Phycisphaerae bacterium]|jgi:nitroreductase